MKKIFVIMGKASSGKDTLVKMLSEQLEIPMAVSFTTRPMRDGETQGVEYNFITQKEFKDQLESGEIVEHTSYNVASGETWYYGLTKSELEKADYVIAIVNPEGLRLLKYYYEDKVVPIFINSKPDVRIKRYLNRDIMDEEKVAECCRRFLADKKDFERLIPNYEIFNNDEIIDAYQTLEHIVRREKAKDILESAREGFLRDATRSLCS
ncbi:guanylate kinase [Romboutsia sp.]|uniref:guanylate kinase n=1 Tax=Romboutsia sp. TaxID=1965302 RepID=UPI002BB85E81|nr:guanylate kinase [Romboutsia sp.]HSQ89800.1 guanylate kinase [Romboutsia sp.]